MSSYGSNVAMSGSSDGGQSRVSMSVREHVFIPLYKFVGLKPAPTTAYCSLVVNPHVRVRLDRAPKCVVSLFSKESPSHPPDPAAAVLVGHHSVLIGSSVSKYSARHALRHIHKLFDSGGTRGTDRKRLRMTGGGSQARYTAMGFEENSHKLRA